MVRFALTSIVLFGIIVAFLAAVDALPERKERTGTSDISRTSDVRELPARVVAPSIGMNVAVENPDSTDIRILDDALLRGAVRWPGSAWLGEDGTVFIFGHSSYLPVVYNQAYRAFNKIQDLATGDIISVYSGTTEYRYKVTGVRLADASEDVVELRADGRYLTLVTCDSFGRKTSRFVVTAEFASSYTL